MSITRFFGALGIKTAAVILVSVAVWAFLVVRLDLFIQPGYLLLTATTALAAIAAIVITNMFKPVGLAAGVILLWVAIQAKAPAVAESIQVVAEVGQEQIVRTAEDMTHFVPQKIACDKTTAEHQVFFETNRETGEPEVVMGYTKNADGHIQCWDIPGARHPHTAERIKFIDAETVARIKEQSPESGPEEKPEESSAEDDVQEEHRQGRRQRFASLPS